MVSTAETASGEMAVEVGEVPAEGAMAVEVGELPVEGAKLPADEAELSVTFGGAVGAQAETIRKIPQIASSPR